MLKSTQNKAIQIQHALPILIWILLFITPLLIGDFDNGINWNHVIKIWKEYSFLLILFLLNRFVFMPKLFLKQKKVAFFISILITIALFSVILYYIQDINIEKAHPLQRSPLHDHSFSEDLRPKRSGGPMRPGGPNGPGGPGPKEMIPPFLNFIVMSILLIGFDSGLMFFSKWTQSEQKKLKAEKESIKNKMAFLQTQVSPHFFMNTLNNIHALVDIDTEEAKEAIIKLSQMMSYMLYESQTNTVPLQQELEFIQSYIDLMKLRFTDDVEIKVDLPETMPTVKIPPLLTISFIENAFKYGVSYEAFSYIHIAFKINKNQLMMHVSNSVHAPKVEKKNSGIGIENARNRLNLIYGDNYDLSINESSTKFEVNLNTPL